MFLPSHSLDMLQQQSPPLISIVMTTFNGAAYLKEQIESILNQSCANFELIVADDCSSDDTVEIIRAFAGRDQRIRYYVNDSNLGLNRNLGNALTKTQGRFIAIADQDDIWESHKLETSLNHLGPCIAIYSDSQLIDDFGQPLGLSLLERIGLAHLPVGEASLALLRKNCVSGHTLLFKKELLPLVLPFAEGLMFDQQIAVAAVLNGGLQFIDMQLVRHRLHGQNQINGSMLPGNLSDHTKVERYRMRRAMFARMLGFLVGHVEKNTKHYRHKKKILWLCGRVAELIPRLENFDNNRFDVRLFALLLIVRHEMFYAGEPNKFKRCLTYAKGARYYQ